MNFTVTASDARDAVRSRSGPDTAQGALPFVATAEAAPAIWSVPENAVEDRGAVFTRREIVEFILDLVGYTVDCPLPRFRLLEPAFGQGDFLLPAVERLLQAYARQGGAANTIAGGLADAIRAVEVHPGSIRATRAKICALLATRGVSEEDAERLVRAWIVEGDFLLAALPQSFTHIVGNPPYVRQERIPNTLLAIYRARYRTLYDRADLYVPFIERCLTRLVAGGELGFICADRWIKNKYGGPLRAMIAARYHLVHYVDMRDAPAFHAEVDAYPAITVIRRENPGPTRVAQHPPVDRDALARLAASMRSPVLPEDGGVVEVAGVTRNREPWVLDAFDRLAVVRRLEAEFPTLEAVGCRIGIGVATGADRVFIGPFEDLDVEPDRKLPLVMTQDIRDGAVKWRGLGVINPFGADGSLVNLARYPRLARYLEAHAEAVRGRNCAKKNPKNWYRTIDRIDPELTRRPKLLIPDIKGTAHIVYEEGRYYPHHNLYFIISDEWDLKALQVVLRSGIAKLFVATYSTPMRGGYLRFQAQYLRRIRLPRWDEVPESVKAALIAADGVGERTVCNRAVFDLYRLTPEERAVVETNH